MKKRVFTLLFCGLISFLVIYKLDTIVTFCTNLFNGTPKVVLEDKNKYAKNGNYAYVKTTDNFVPYNYQELLNIIYTVLDAGYDNFTFYCPNEYTDCISDIEKISDPSNVDILTTLGNYVSPFNNFTSIRIEYDTAGEITIDINHLYSDEEITKINTKIDEIWKTIVKKDMTKEDIIYTFHDYIINHTKYDINYEKELKTGVTTHQSSKAIGPLFEGYAICSGYTDTLAIILDRLGIPNFKVASNTHVWNAVKMNEEWEHIDLTWDDPVSENHETNNLLHKFFLINTKTLEEFDIKDHTFNKSTYIELK